MGDDFERYPTLFTIQIKINGLSTAGAEARRNNSKNVK